MAQNNIAPQVMQLINRLLGLFQNNFNPNQQIREFLVQLGDQIHVLEQDERTIVQIIFELQNQCIMMQQREITSIGQCSRLNQEIDVLNTLIEVLRRQRRPPPAPMNYPCPTHNGDNIPIQGVNILGEVQWICPIRESRNCRNGNPSFLLQDVNAHIGRCIRNHNWVCPGPPVCVPRP